MKAPLACVNPLEGAGVIESGGQSSGFLILILIFFLILILIALGLRRIDGQRNG